MERDVAIRDVRSVGPGTIAVDLETPDGFEARPGQFVQVRAVVDDEDVTRYYTLSSPDVTDTFEITVGVDPDGDLSPWLAGADPGDTVEISGPHGRSYYEDEERIVVVAGGPGIGPAVGIGERAVSEGNEVAIVYQDDQPAHEDRLEALESKDVPVSVVDSDDTLLGPIEESLAAVGGQVFVYGFADFLDEAHDALDAAGYDPDEAKSENFG